MLYKRLFGAVYDRFMHSLEKEHLSRRRARLLAGLSGRVLEIGVGTGANLEHYPEEAELTGIEPSPYMLVRAEKKRQMLVFPDRITLHRVGCGTPEMEDLIAPGSLDGVVSTLVLCSVPDPEKAIQNFFKWLKPGGKLVILEHVRAHRLGAARFQDLLNPIWQRVADGCQLNRPTDQMLADSGFRPVRVDRFRLGLPFIEAEYTRP